MTALHDAIDALLDAAAPAARCMDAHCEGDDIERVTPLGTALSGCQSVTLITVHPDGTLVEVVVPEARDWHGQLRDMQRRQLHRRALM